MRKNNVFIVSFAVIISAWMITSAVAQTYPVKPVRFVLGASPDLLPRLIAQKLSERWGQQVVVDQRPGAGGVIAGDLVSKATPDGYTWLMSTGAFYAVEALYPKLPYSMARDLAPVTMMATIPFVAVVHPKVPAKSLTDLVRLAKASPGKFNYASAGTGTTTQLAAELFRLSAKIDVVHIPYKGVVAAVTDILGGQVHMMFSVAQAVVPHVLSGKLRALAVTSSKRSPAVPDVPTIIEAGFPDIDMVAWNGIHMPVNTPRALVRKVNADVRSIIGQKETSDRMIAAGLDIADTTVGQFTAYIKKDILLYTRVISEARIKLN